MADDKVSVEISIEERAALKALTQLSRGVTNFEKGATQSIKKTDMAISSFAGNLSAIAASKSLGLITDGLKELVVGSLDAAAQTEKLKTQFEVLTGSANAASSLFQQLTEFSASTPFQLNNIAEAASQLLSFGFAASEVQGRIEKIGEVAAGSNSDLKEVALIYGQVSAAGKLTGERLLQLQERAIPIGAALANTLGVAESEVRELVSSGVVGFKEFEQAFNSMSESGGIFEGAIDRQSQTLNGVLSTLSDNFSLLQTEIGRAFSPAVIAGAQGLTKALQALKPVVSDVADTTGALVGWLTADEGVESARAEIKALEATMNDVKNTTDRVNSVLGEDSWLGKINRSRADERIKNIRTEIDELTKSLKTQGVDVAAENLAEMRNFQSEFEASQGKKVTSEQETNAKLLEERRKLYSDLLMLEQEQMQLEAERDLAASELDVDKRVQALEQIKFHEIQKADIALQAELEKNKKIRDARSKELADQQAFARNQLAISRSQAKAEAAIAQARVENQDKMVAGFGAATMQAANIAKKGTNEQKLFAVAAATINTYAAATRAFRDYPYPANLAVMATTIAAGLNQVSQIQKQSFFTGGVVGGFSGATNGMDNTTANVRTGEMVLNGNQQRQLFDIATGKENTGSGELISAINRLASQAITVEVDGREIARTVRNQRLEGFV